MMEQQPTDQQKHDYLMQWHWTTETHEDGFLVYSHRRFPNCKYLLRKAYEKMRENEPSLEPVVSARRDNPEEMQKVSDYLTTVVGSAGSKEIMDYLETRPKEENNNE